MKRLVILGASGSIGMQTIDVVLQHPDEFSIQAIGIGRNIEQLHRILKEIDVRIVSVQNEKDAESLAAIYPDITFHHGDEGLITLASSRDYDVLVNALVGFAGFMPTLTAIESGHDVALANKETLVCGGSLIEKALDKYGRKLYPIDSEHSAVFQALQGNDPEDVKRLIITASGGSFRNLTREQLKDVTVEQALAHPNWSMGAKITIDSADMMNKGFEVIEAHWLFRMPYERIDVLMHPESVIHSMVEYVDHSVMAQLGVPDMRIPIQYALTYPGRETGVAKQLRLEEYGNLTFEKPDNDTFICIELCRRACSAGGLYSALVNGANEQANLLFRQGRIGFLQIGEAVAHTLDNIKPCQPGGVDEIFETDRIARRAVNDYFRIETEQRL